MDANFERFLSWFGGEWNNHEQVWQQDIDAKSRPDGKPEDPIAHTHHVFAPITAPKLGKHLFYVQQSMEGAPAKIYRQRVYSMSIDAAEDAIKLEIFSLPDDKAFVNAHLKPELFNALEPGALKAIAGCEVYWRYQPALKEFVGTMKANACSFVSSRLGKRIIITDTLKLSESEIWINDQARDEQGGYVFGSKTNTPVKNRKVRYFTGWAYMNKAGKNAGDADKTFGGRRDLLLHNEGQILPVLWDDGSASPYQLQLARLTYQNTKNPILKLSLIEVATQKTVAYVWANPDAKLVGMNLGWAQVGVTQKTQRESFGFGDAPAATASPK
jgi:hypothetical protein